MYTNWNNLPVINKPAVRCDVGGPDLTSPLAARVAPPRVQATPPNATNATRNLNGGPRNHCPQQPLPERSDGVVLQ